MTELQQIYDTPPWGWPKTAASLFLAALQDPDMDKANRLLAARMAGNFVVINDELAESLLKIVNDSRESEELRSRAVISFGAALDYIYFDMEEFAEIDEYNDFAVTELLESNELFSPLAWTTRDAYTFLQEVPLYEEAGILCRIPDWWKVKTTGVKLKISLGEQQPAMVGMAALLDFSPRLMLGEDEISMDEIKRLLDEVEGLAFIKNKWVAVDREKLEQTLLAYEEAQKLTEQEGLTLAEAMRLQLQSGTELLSTKGAEILEIEHGQWLQSVFHKIAHPGKLPQVNTDDRFKAQLRPYQQDGLRWLSELLRVYHQSRCWPNTL